MNGLNRTRCALSVYAAGILLAGCGGDLAFPKSGAIAPSGAAVIAARAPKLKPSGGGQFTAMYSGTFSFATCVVGLNGRDGSFAFTGTGKGSFIRDSSESGTLVRGRSGPDKICNGYWYGEVTLTSRQHRRNTISFVVKGNAFGSLTPCLKALPCGFSVSGGTGKFSAAAGSGGLLISHSSSIYSDSWSGTITY